MNFSMRGKQAFKRSEVPSEILLHISYLENETANALAQVKVMSAELACVEERLRLFLEEYYGEVGQFFGDLEKLNHDISTMEKKSSKHSFKIVNGDYKMREQEVIDVYVQRGAIKDQEIKQLFRKLAKYCHPDTSDLPEAKEIFASVNEAYEKRDLCSLILIEQSIMETNHFSNENDIQKLERLEEKYQMALREKDALLQRKHNLKSSRSYQLWQCVFKEKSQGRDVVREIKSNVMREIKDKKTYIANHRKELATN